MGQPAVGQPGVGEVRIVDPPLDEVNGNNGLEPERADRLDPEQPDRLEPVNGGLEQAGQHLEGDDHEESPVPAAGRVVEHVELSGQEKPDQPSEAARKGAPRKRIVKEKN